MKESVKLYNRNWKKITSYFNSKNLNKRKWNQCRERYIYNLNPELTKGKWKKEEELLLLKKNIEFGNLWKKIREFLINRSGNCIKNKFYCMLRKAIRKSNKTFGSKILVKIIKNLKASTISFFYSIIHKKNRNEKLNDFEFNNIKNSKRLNEFLEPYLFQKKINYKNDIEDCKKEYTLLIKNLDILQNNNENDNFSFNSKKINDENNIEEIFSKESYNNSISDLNYEKSENIIEEKFNNNIISSKVDIFNNIFSTNHNLKTFTKDSNNYNNDRITPKIFSINFSSILIRSI